jgi:hypothetical protein
MRDNMGMLVGGVKRRRPAGKRPRVRNGLPLAPLRTRASLSDLRFVFADYCTPNVCP